MPTYRITDQQSGRTLRLTGDAPPTEAEIQRAFLDAANATPLSEPETYDEGWRKGMGEGMAGGALGFAEGVVNSPIDAIRGVVGLVQDPLGSVKRGVTGAIEGLRSAASTTASLLGAPMSPRAEEIGADPQAFGREVGSGVGQLALTAKPSMIPKAVGAAGKGLEAAGKSRVVSRASTYGAVGSGMGGNLAGAVAAASAPAALRGVGKGLQRGAGAVERGMERAGQMPGRILERGRARFSPPPAAAPPQPQAPSPRLLGPATSMQLPASSLDEALNASILAEGGVEMAPAAAAAATPQVFPTVKSWKPGYGPTADIAQRYRQQFGSREAARRLRTTPGQVKALTPDMATQLPASARAAIDAELAALSPDDLTAYIDAAPNDLVREYLRTRVR